MHFVQREKGKTMSELIEKSNLYDAIANREDEYRSALLREKNYNSATALQLQGLLNATTLIKHLVFDFPTIDAVTVVRCKDCKHLFTDFVMDGKEYKRCEMQMAGFHDDWYCADGERKQNE